MFEYDPQGVGFLFLKEGFGCRILKVDPGETIRFPSGIPVCPPKYCPEKFPDHVCLFVLIQWISAAIMTARLHW